MLRLITNRALRLVSKEAIVEATIEQASSGAATRGDRAAAVLAACHEVARLREELQLKAIRFDGNCVSLEFQEGWGPHMVTTGLDMEEAPVAKALMRVIYMAYRTKFRHGLR